MDGVCNELKKFTYSHLGKNRYCGKIELAAGRIQCMGRMIDIAGKW